MVVKLQMYKILIVHVRNGLCSTRTIMTV